MKMKNEKKLIVSLVFFAIFLIVGAGFIFSESEVSYCCEKTVEGAYCQNVPDEEMCNTNVKESGEQYGVSPSACGSTSYCELGCCYDSDEGICMSNTPREACEVKNGEWRAESNCDIPQCELGCCLIGTEAAYVTLARCNKLSGEYGVTPEFNRDVEDDLACLRLATSQDLGACVYEKDFIDTCKFTTRGECNAKNVEKSTNVSSVTFYKDYLCTAERLDTDCEPSESTRCEDRKVYFEDTCGNRGNIYDANKINNDNYWSKIVPASESCDDSPRSCGNCEYLGKGTICGDAERGENPEIGDKICKDVNCYDTSNGNDYKNGESWCVYDNDNPGEDSVGSRHFRHICFMGEEIVEPCADFRQEICFEDTIGEEEDFSQAGCGVNRWEECTAQDSAEDCLNTDKRECVWLPLDDEFNLLTKFGSSSVSETMVDREIARLIVRANQMVPESISPDVGSENSICVPRYSPGLEFWNEGNSEKVCAVADKSCVVKYEKDLIGGEWECVENCWCNEPETEAVMAMVCSKLGDCGPGYNYFGDYVYEGYSIEVTEGESKEEVASSQSKPEEPTENTDSRTFGGSQDPVNSGGPSPPTGGVIKDFIKNSYNKVVD